MVGFWFDVLVLSGVGVIRCLFAGFDLCSFVIVFWVGVCRLVCVCWFCGLSVTLWVLWL